MSRRLLAGAIAVLIVVAVPLVAGPLASPAKRVVLFEARDSGGTDGYALWRTDGTPTGTVLVKRFPGGTGSPIPVKSVLAFVHVTLKGKHIELWRTDGTGAGTVPFWRIPAPDVHYGYLRWFAPLNGLASFVVSRMQPARQRGSVFWETDGTAKGTRQVGGVRDLVVSEQPVLFRHRLFFAGEDSRHGTELWSTDGTAAGTRLVKDVFPGPSGSGPTCMTAVGSTLYFGADDGVHGAELWRSDGSAAGTRLVKDVVPGPPSSISYSCESAGVNGHLFFLVQGSGEFFSLWETDGTAAGTHVFGPALPERVIRQHGKDVLFYAFWDRAHGQELWRTDGTAGRTSLLRDVYPGRQSSDPSVWGAIGGVVYFNARDPRHPDGSVFWKSDGTSRGTRLVGRLFVAQGGVTLAGRVYLNAADPGTGNEGEPWVSDGTVAGTRLLKDIWPGPTSSEPQFFPGAVLTLRPKQ